MEAEQLSKIDLTSFPEPGRGFRVESKIDGGTGGDVFEAKDPKTGKNSAVKMIELTDDSADDIRREYFTYGLVSSHENFLDFYGMYLKTEEDGTRKIWLHLELCEGLTATDFTRKMKQVYGKTSEVHVAYILRETVKAVIYLHENNICHRDIRGSNILVGPNGNVKLIDFGTSGQTRNDEPMNTFLGSPGWMAPEMIPIHARPLTGYDEKIDVWALGITAIELGDGQVPYEESSPSRALIQTANNPPPTLRKPSDWSQDYNDFISECLIKDPKFRPWAQELLEHTFLNLSPITEKHLIDNMDPLIKAVRRIPIEKKPEIQIRNKLIKTEGTKVVEKMFYEDLVALPVVTEETVLNEIQARFYRNEFFTFAGDILLALNPNAKSDPHGNQFHVKYRFKAKSQNAPHVYAIADGAYRNVFHHEKPQQILFAGETGSGKTVNFKHALEHLLFLGKGLKTAEKIRKALDVVQAMGTAATRENSHSTRHILQTRLTFTDTGKVSGAIFELHQLEIERVTDKNQANFHLFYYFYNAMIRLGEFHLNRETEYKYLKLPSEFEQQAVWKENNVEQYRVFENNLRDLEFTEYEINAIRSILAAILLIGQIDFVQDGKGNIVFRSCEPVERVALLLGVERETLGQALLTCRLVTKGEVTVRRSFKTQERKGKHAFARHLYSRLVDWLVNNINEKLAVSRVIYGGKHIIGLTDFYGFEVYETNGLSQLFVNTVNEQLQRHYNEKIFGQNEEVATKDGISVPNIAFEDNIDVVEDIISRPNGILSKICEATEKDEELSEIMKSAQGLSNRIAFDDESLKQFTIKHYAGYVTYNTNQLMEKNKDFLPPELIETMTLSTNEVIKHLFSSRLTKTGNVSMKPAMENDNLKVSETNALDQYFQLGNAAMGFRGVLHNLSRNLAIDRFGFHYVRCIRTNENVEASDFQPGIVRRQLKALAVVETINNVREGYSHCMQHKEFIRRYKHLAFDYNENPEETKENCRLLLLRLKLEGWALGQTRVFLKYYNIEYLTRLYEGELKKIIKVQAMMRRFISRRQLYKKILKYQQDESNYSAIVNSSKFHSMRVYNNATDESGEEYLDSE